MKTRYKIRNKKTPKTEVPITSFQFKTTKEKGKPLKTLSDEAHKDAVNFPFSKRSTISIYFSSKILALLSEQAQSPQNTEPYFST